MGAALPPPPALNLSSRRHSYSPHAGQNFEAVGCSGVSARCSDHVVDAHVDETSGRARWSHEVLRRISSTGLSARESVRTDRQPIVDAIRYFSGSGT